MKKRLSLLFIAILIIGLFNATGFILSTKLSFNYMLLSPYFLLLYLVAGYIFTWKTNLKTAVVLTALLGFFDAQMGWVISSLANTNVGAYQLNPGVIIWTAETTTMTLFGAFIGLIGGIINRAIANTRKSNTIKKA